MTTENQIPEVPVVTVCKHFGFEAAHYLPNHYGKCRNLHGHSYKLEVYFKGPVCNIPDRSSEGMVVDFSGVSTCVDKVLLDFDHCSLNQVLKIPTAENLVIELWNRITDQLGLSMQAHNLPSTLTLTKLVLWETRKCSAEYTGEKQDGTRPSPSYVA